MITPRPYQSAAVAAVFDRLVARREQSTLIVCATGLGKTVIFGLVAQEWMRIHSGRILVLAHREELISQAVSELAGILGYQPAIEMADAWASPLGSTLDGDSPGVVVASVQSLSQPRRLSRWPVDEFSLVITDEAHHATSASYKRIFDHFRGAKRLGVTATPKRADDFALGHVFGSVAYEMGICEAVDEGYLVTVEQRYVTVRDMDLSEVKTEGGDFAQGALGTVLSGDHVLDQMVAATIKLCGDEPTLIFTAPRPPGEVVSQGDLFADALNAIKPGKAIFLSGETEKEIRKRELSYFEQGQRQYLVGCSLFTEGFNVPKISRVVMARPTKSVVYYTQAIGRGTRSLRDTLRPEHVSPEDRQRAIRESKKPSVLVIDFVGNSGRHKLVSAVDIFAGKHDAEAIARAKKKAEATSRPRPVQELLAEAEAELKRERAAKEEAERKRRERKARVKVNRVVMDQHDVNPYEASDGSAQKKAGVAGIGKATAMQMEWINKHGGYCDANLSSEGAGKKIAEIKRRWNEGLCSPRQERALRNRGMCDGPIPKYHAKALMDWLSACNWDAVGRPRRSQLGIVSVPNGLNCGYQLTIDKVKVGGIFASPAKVREVYAGLCVDQPATVS